MSWADGRLADAAQHLGESFVRSTLNPDQEGQLAGQEKQLYGTYGQVFDAIAENMEKGGGDMKAFWRVLRKARATRKAKGEIK
ncbi:MAG: hypothetical protein ACE5FU_11825 [Nitrospinota bacterium]